MTEEAYPLARMICDDSCPDEPRCLPRKPGRLASPSHS